MSSKPGCPGEGDSQVPGTGRVAGPSSDPTFAFHVVMHLELHFAGPEDVELWTSEVAAATAAESVQGLRDTGEGRARDWGTGGRLSGKGKLGRKRSSQPASWERHGIGDG